MTGAKIAATIAAIGAMTGKTTGGTGKTTAGIGVADPACSADSACAPGSLGAGRSRDRRRGAEARTPAPGDDQLGDMAGVAAGVGPDADVAGRGMSDHPGEASARMCSARRQRVASAYWLKGDPRMRIPFPVKPRP
jgi:hypothetical protein